MAAAAEQCGLRIVTGDTKVVERGKADGLFISTSGVGTVELGQPVLPTAIRPGDQLLLSGDLGRHGVAILAARHGLDLQPPVLSDCAPLWPQVEALLRAGVTPCAISPAVVWPVPCRSWRRGQAWSCGWRRTRCR
jgi:hydrogenase expression/formation protein HypE